MTTPSQSLEALGPGFLATDKKASPRLVGAAAVASEPDQPRIESSIAVVDEYPLRLASTLMLLRSYLREAVLTYRTCGDLLASMPSKADPATIVVNVGGRSITDDEVHRTILRLRATLSGTPVIVVSELEELAEVLAAFRLGARGFIPSSVEPRVAVGALRLVRIGGTFFPANVLCRRSSPLAACPAHERTAPDDHWTPRQKAVLRLLVMGRANKQIARTLDMEESTVKAHVRLVMRKLGARNRTEAALRASTLDVLGELAQYGAKRKAQRHNQDLVQSDASPDGRLA